MSVDAPVQRTRSSAPRGSVRGLAFGTIALGSLGLLALVATAISSTTGQVVDDAAMKAVTASNTAELTLLSALGRISIGAILAVAAGCVTIAVVRRRLGLAVGAVTIIAGANVTTQALKALLERPDLGLGVHNSLPSGHTTVVASAVAALLLVVPPVARGVMAAVGSAAIGVTGLSTIVAGWHRPADVAAALLVVLVWAAAVALVAGGTRGRIAVTSLAALLGAATAVVFLVALGVRPAPSWHDAALATAVLGAVAAFTSLAVTVLAVISPDQDR